MFQAKIAPCRLSLQQLRVLGFTACGLLKEERNWARKAVKCVEGGRRRTAGREEMGCYLESFQKKTLDVMSV